MHPNFRKPRRRKKLKRELVAQDREMLEPRRRSHKELVKARKIDEHSRN